jgi:hypothetical protein
MTILRFKQPGSDIRGSVGESESGEPSAAPLLVQGTPAPPWPVACNVTERAEPVPRGGVECGRRLIPTRFVVSLKNHPARPRRFHDASLGFSSV